MIHQSSYRFDAGAQASCQICKIAGLACAGNAGNVCYRHFGLAILTCITALAWRTCRDACRDRKLAVSFEVSGGKNVPGITVAWATRNFTYLARGPHSSAYCISIEHAWGRQPQCKLWLNKSIPDDFWQRFNSAIYRPTKALHSSMELLIKVWRRRLLTHRGVMTHTYVTRMGHHRLW